MASGSPSLVQSSPQLSFFRFLLGAGEGGCFPGAAKGILEWFPARERALAMGIATTGGSAIGAVLAPPLIVWAAAQTGWRGAFVVTGLIGAVWIVLWFAFYRQPEQSRFATDAERNHILADRTRQTDERARRPWPLAKLLSRKEVWASP